MAVPTTSSTFLGLNTWTQRTVFFGYISLWVVQFMLVYHFRHERPDLNFTIVAALLEGAKLTFSLVAYFKKDFVSLAQLNFSVLGPVFLRYIIPALLYAMYNNLTYVVLSVTDPGTYGILGQVRTIMTAFIWKYTFQTTLSTNKWKGLFLITGGCLLKGLGGGGGSADGVNMTVLLLVLFQVSCATGAGIYMEFLLKGYKDIPVNLQNIFMYVNCIIGNVLIMLFRHQYSEDPAPPKKPSRFITTKFGGTLEVVGPLPPAVLPTPPPGLGEEVWDIFTDPLALTVVFWGACAGMSTGFFLRYLDSVRKTIATSIEISILPFASAILFGSSIDLATVVAVALVAYGALMYSRPAEEKKTVVKPAGDVESVGGDATE